ncbi:hypothetical protein [Hanamia caeni]|nr:hypothetical protein [Hanamia caeni]
MGTVFFYISDDIHRDINYDIFFLQAENGNEEIILAGKSGYDYQ